MATSWRNKKNYPLGVGTLNAAITSSGLTIVLDASQGANFPSASFTVSIDEEIILIDSRSTDTLTVNASGRGYDGSTAAAHSAGVTVANYQIAKDFTDLENAVNSIENGTTTLAKIVASGGAASTITVDDSGTNTVITILALYHTSSGTPASGLGSKVLLGAENSTGSSVSAAELQGYLSTVTAGAEQGAFLLQLRNAGALQDALAITVGSNSVTIGSNQTTATLWNTTETTVAAFNAATALTIATAGTNPAITIGAGSSGTITLNVGTIRSTQSTVNLFAVSTNVTLCSAATTLAFAAAATIFTIGPNNTGTITIRNATVALSGTTAFTVAAPSTFSGDVTMADAKNIIVNATTGTRFGTATTQKIGLWNATPIVQPASANQAALTNNSGGTYDGTIQALTDPADTPATADALRDDLVANLIPQLRNNFTELYTLQNAIRDALVSSGMMKGAA